VLLGQSHYRVTNSFSFWSDGAPVQPGQPDYSFNYWSDGAPAPFFVLGLQVNADPGLFAVSGSESNFRADRVIQAGAGSFSVSGGSALFHATLTAGTGSFLVSTFSASLIYGGNPEPPTPPSPPPQIGGGIIVGKRRISKPTKKSDHQIQPIIRKVLIKAETAKFLFSGGSGFVSAWSPPDEEDDAAFAIISVLLDDH